MAAARAATGTSGQRHHWYLGACRTWDVDSEKRPQRGQFLLDLPAHSPAMGQKDGEKWTAAAASQPTLPKSDRLLAAVVKVCSWCGRDHPQACGPMRALSSITRVYVGLRHVRLSWFLSLSFLLQGGLSPYGHLVERTMKPSYCAEQGQRRFNGRGGSALRPIHSGRIPSMGTIPHGTTWSSKVEVTDEAVPT